MIRIGSICRCETIVVVSHKSLLRRVREVMSTHYFCITFHALRIPYHKNDKCDITNCFSLRSKDEMMNIEKAACGGVHHVYFSTARIVN